MKTITQYQCEVCKVCYLVKELAEACERHVPKPLDVKVGQEVRLKNRNTGYTLALVKDIHINSLHPIFENVTQEIFNKWPKRFIETTTFHEFVIELDREVCLDHKWENATSIVCDIYVLTDEQAKNSFRDDNNGW